MPDKSIYKKYRLLPLVGAGVLVLMALVLLALLIWSLAAFGGQRDPAPGSPAAAVIYLGAVFLSCLVMTLLIRGGTVFPSAVLGLIAAAVSLLLAPDGAAAGRLVLKVLLTLAAAVAGFVVAKLTCGFSLSGPTPQPAKEGDSLSPWDGADSSMNEPGK